MQLIQLKRSNSLFIALIDGSGVKAGFPSPAQDYIQQSIDLNDLLIKHPSATFIIDVQGDSMVDAYIPESCRVIIDRALTAKNNDIILALVNGEYTIKRLRVFQGRHELHACNQKKKYPPIVISEGMQYEIFGVVTTVLVNPRESGV